MILEPTSLILCGDRTPILRRKPCCAAERTSHAHNGPSSSAPVTSSRDGKEKSGVTCMCNVLDQDGADARALLVLFLVPTMTTEHERTRNVGPLFSCSHNHLFQP